MAREAIELDEQACAKVMARFGLQTKEAAVNLALRRVALGMTLEEARAMEGTGWDGDLDEMRAMRTFD